MRKIIFNIGLCVVLALSTQHVMAQNTRETSVTYLKQNVNGYVGEYKVSKSNLQEIAANYFSKNIKGKRLKNKDFYQYKGVNWNIISLDQSDVYYKVDGNKSSSTLTILVSKGYDNYVSTATDAVVSEELKQFFTTFNTEIDKFTLKERIEAQKDVIKKLEKDHKSMENEESKLIKKIADLQKEIDKNKSKYDSKNKEILKQKQILSEMESGLK